MEESSGALVIRNPLLGDERRIQEVKNCEQTSSLATTFVSDTQAYGVMFTVRGKDEALLIETLELSSVFLGNQREIHVLVYTKEGAYQNFQNNPSAWVKIADTNLTPSMEGRGTLIPTRQFHPVQVEPYNVRAFYVTLDTTDLRYSNAPGRPVGSVYAQDEFLQIQVGAGLLEYPFSNRIFEPRVFCGIVHYKRIVDCDRVAIATTKVSYAFLVQHDNMSDNIVISQVNTIVQGSVLSLLSSEPELTSYKQSASLALESVDTTVSTAFNPEAYAECISNTVRKCTALVTEVLFKHKDDLDRGTLVYRMLRYRSQVTSNLNLGNSMDVTYVGMVPLETEMLVRLDRAPSDQTMNTKQSSYFESITQMFLEDKLSINPSVTILGVRVNEQHSASGRRLSVAQRQLKEEGSLSAFDVSTVVTAALRPPPFVDFDALVEDAIDFNADEYRDDLVNRKDLRLDVADGRFFEQLKHIAVRPVNGTDRNTNASKSEEINGAMAGWAIMLIIILFLLMGVGGMYFAWKRFIVKEEEEEEQPQRESTETEDYMSHIYENAFRGFDEKESELLVNATGSDHKKRKPPQTRSHKKAPPQRTMPPPPSAAGRNPSASGLSRSGRSSSRNMGLASSGYSSRGMEPSPGLTGTMDNASETVRKKMARAPSDRVGGDAIHSDGMKYVPDYSRNRSARSSGERRGPPDYSRINRSNRSAPSVTAENALPACGDAARARSTRGATDQHVDDVASIGMRRTPPTRIDPVNREHDDDISTIGDMSVAKYALSQSGMQSSSHHTVKRNNRRDSKASSIGISSQHTVKRNNATDRNLGTKQGSGIDKELLQSYMQDPEALIETSGHVA
mmetsp:Transcript_31942/g.52725  ORF Transcript_31942/g.52725 Transcript_31942/m.52725 type:complete len:847 (+) Transcript_31942:28-2568(+)